MSTQSETQQTRDDQDPLFKTITRWERIVQELTRDPRQVMIMRFGVVHCPLCVSYMSLTNVQCETCPLNVVGQLCMKRDSLYNQFIDHRWAYINDRERSPYLADEMIRAAQELLSCLERIRDDRQKGDTQES